MINISSELAKSTKKVFDYISSRSDLENRLEQEFISSKIADAISNNHNIMVEAGVGIGKSFAYLIPSILYYMSTGRPVILTTSSIALTEQLMGDVSIACDLISKALNRNCFIKPYLAMGARNYVCKDRVINLIRQHKGKRNNNRNNIPYEVLQEAKVCDEKKQFKMPIRPDWWNKINGSSCNRYDCKQKANCAYAKMRQAIGNRGNAKLIIINQDMYIANLKLLRNGMNGIVNEAAGVVIVDEGHNLEDKTRAALTIMKDKDNCIKLMNSVSKEIDRIRIAVNKNALQKIIEHSKTNINIIFRLAEMLANDYKKKSKRNEDATRFYPPREEEGIKTKALEAWIKNLETIQRYITLDIRATHDEKTLDGLGDFIDLVKAYFDDDHNVTWFQSDKDTNFTMNWCSAPQSINLELSRMLFNKILSSVVVTSATLTQNGNSIKERYQYTIDSIGFRGTLVKPQLSPFPYDANAKLYIANDIQSPSNDEKYTLYLNQISKRILQLANITKGRTLCLFTSKTDMEYVGKVLKDKSSGFHIIVQSNSGSQKKIINEFIKTKGILLSTGLWEGFNVIGSDLSSVIIAKLPFPVPDPIIDRKIELTGDRNKVLIPEMLRKLRQGAGRLIRSKKDTGILSILDSRLLHSELLETVIPELPIKKYTLDLTEIEEFSKHKIRD